MRSSASRRFLRPITVLAVAALCGLGVGPAAQAAPPGTASAAFTGGARTALVGSTLYARSGASLTLNVDAPSDTHCVDVSGAVSAHQSSSTGRSTWSFAFTAGSGDDVQAVTVAASSGVNGQDKCTGRSVTTQAAFTLDNTAPIVSAALAPAANAAGWNNSDVSLSWSASDAGSGVASGPSPVSDVQTGTTTGVVKTATATDRVGNVGSGSVTVKVDKGAPTVSLSRAPLAGPDGWNNTDVSVSVTCTDLVSGTKTCSGGGTVVVSAEGADQFVTGTAVDNADNSASASLTGISIDKTKPTLTGAPTTAATNGWYRGDVVIRWTATDGLSGIAAGAAPADSTIGGEGADLTATASVSDRAGNTTTATSPGVSIDRTPPVTTLTGTPANDWTSGDVSLSLSATDARSGVATTTFTLDGGAPQTGDQISLTNEGDHTITFSSTDVAGNAEAAQTVHVRIDKTLPQIAHEFTPSGYVEGSWTNGAVGITFTCSDAGGSQVADCTGPVEASTEGVNVVNGTVTDGAGNSASDFATVRIDTTPPTISGSTTATHNPAGWYRTLVPVAFDCADERSGLADCTPSSVLGEGAGQSVTGTARDAAGNVAHDTFGPVDVDLTPPALSADYTSGWHTGDVAIDWSCTDALSGPAAQPAHDVVQGEGANLSSSATCDDVAGNSASLTVSGIQIDRTAPATSAGVPSPLASGWYSGPVQVTLTGTDATSGVRHTYYAVDGGSPVTYDGPFSFGAKGIHTITYWSVDVAGNVEQHALNTLTLKIDGLPPTTTLVNPISPASGWYVVSGIPVAFTATDPESGVQATYYTIDGGPTQVYGEPFEASLGEGEHTIVYWSVDNADNAETHHSVTVSVDTVAPTVGAAVSAGTLGANGWYTSAVTVHFTCADLTSGVATCPEDVTLSGSGAGQVVSGTVVDRAGNTATASLSLDIDTGAPSITWVNVAGQHYTLGEAVPAATCTATDAASGVASCLVSVIGGNANGVGTFTWTATATDNAGNVATSTGTYKVVYRFDGFLQPINDTAHQIGLATSVFKAGSTVPAKFQVKRVDGSVVTPVSVPKWIAPVQGSRTALAVDESVYSAVTDSGSVYRYDATTQQWQYNWKSLTAGYYWRVGVTLDDGETYYVNLALR